MRITTRLILSFLLASILPLAVVGYAGLRAMDRVVSLTLEESVSALKRLGENAIHQQALAVARQVELYLEAHPQLLHLPAEEFEANERLAAIAVQPVGETGYTAVYDDDSLTHFHANPEIVGRHMRDLAADLPAFWDILEASLDGTTVSGYYEWRDADGAVREKYMSCAPVGETHLRVAATTYIDEFYQPIRDTEAEITRISQENRLYLLAALIAVGLLALGLGLWLALGISRPVESLTLAAEGLEQGVYRPDSLAAEALRRDDLGRLARVFDRMAREVQSREATLHRQIEKLRIRIDEKKRARQVAMITETDYFQQLQEKAKEIRESYDRRKES